MLTFIAKKEIKNFLYEKLSAYEINSTNDYIQHEYNHLSFNIKVYKSGIITIDGKKQYDIYNKFISILDEKDFMGMDEVGVGDFFGPTVYCAVRIDEHTIDCFKNLFVNIKDSKKLKDQEIIDIYMKIKSFVNYKIQVVYDKDINKDFNSVMQKMYYHHINYLELTDQKERKVIIDLFTTENNFYKVAKKLKIEYNDNLVLKTQADSKYFVVALASIIARYHFICEMKKLRDKYNFNFAYGANIKIQAQEFADIYSKKEMAKFCKITFKTYNEIQ